MSIASDQGVQCCKKSVRLHPRIACQANYPYSEMLSTMIFKRQVSNSPKPLRIGLELGGGGDRGMAHIAVLQVFDELGIKPARIAGTSMGALIGALYAAGMSGSEMRELVGDMVIKRGEGVRDLLKKPGLLRWLEMIDLEWQRGGLLKGEKVMAFITELLEVERFEELHIPLAVVATDFYTGEQVVFEEGGLAGALRATISIPGIFSPAQVGDRLLVDGGCVNPVPHDLLSGMDYVVGVDVRDFPQRSEERKPGVTDMLIGSAELMSFRISSLIRSANPPDLYLAPPIHGWEMTDFFRAEEILQDAKGICDRLHSALVSLQENPAGKRR